MCTIMKRLAARYFVCKYTLEKHHRIPEYTKILFN